MLAKVKTLLILAKVKTWLILAKIKFHLSKKTNNTKTCREPMVSMFMAVMSLKRCLPILNLKKSYFIIFNVSIFYMC